MLQSAAEFEFPSWAMWPEVPAFGAALVIGSTLDCGGCRALRGKDVLRHVRRDELPDFKSHVAFLLGDDIFLSRLGELEGSIGSVLARAGAPAVISPGFSTWWPWSPFESLVAMARSANFAATLARSLPTVPTLVWRTDRDLEHWARWIVETQARVVAVDLGTLRTPDEWEWGLKSLTSLVGYLDVLGDDPPRLVVNGPSIVERMIDVRSVWRGALTFASQKPWRRAEAGRRLQGDLLDHPDDAERHELAAANQATFESVAAHIASAEPTRDFGSRAA